MRVTQSAHTRCWGVLLAFGLQLPTAAPPAPAAPPTAPPPVARAAALPPIAHVWTRPLDDVSDIMLAASANVLVTAGPSSALSARSLQTGEPVWTHPRSDWDAITATADTVFGVSGGYAYALDAGTGATRWVTQTTGVGTRLVATPGRVLLLSQTDLLLRDAATGTTIWHQGLVAPPSAAAIGSDFVIVGLETGTVVAVDLATGEPRWTGTLDRAPESLVPYPPFTYAALPSGTLCWLRDRDGRRDPCFPLRVPIVGRPVVDQRGLYVALLDGSLRSLDRRSGVMRRTDSLGHRPGTGPWLIDKGLIVALTTGEVVLLDLDTGRVAARVAMPDARSTQLLEGAVMSPDGRVLVTLTIAPGGDRRLAAYRPSDPLLMPLRVVPAPRVTALPTGQATQPPTSAPSPAASGVPTP